LTASHVTISTGTPSGGGCTVVGVPAGAGHPPATTTPEGAKLHEESRAFDSHLAPFAYADLIVDVDAMGVIHARAAARMVALGRGHIANMASLVAPAPLPPMSRHAASKERP
jgi:NAD(P)-dependent dehydrogenase (short-subunit alcohol dehydrogenase family)